MMEILGHRPEVARVVVMLQDVGGKGGEIAPVDLLLPARHGFSATQGAQAGQALVQQGPIGG